MLGADHPAAPLLGADHPAAFLLGDNALRPMETDR
jgi:hypothetical protein